MLRARIRWKNVARAAAIAAAAIAAIAVLPGLVEPPQPPPLPADVGLRSGATDAYAFVARDEGGARAQHATDRGRERSRGDAFARRPPETAQTGAPEREPGSRRTQHDEAAGRNLEAPSEPPSATPITPAPDPPAPPAPVSEPAPAPPPAPAAPAPASSDQVAHNQPPRGPSQFGFEQ